MRITTPVVRTFVYRPPLWQTVGILVAICVVTPVMGYFSFHPPGPVNSLRGIRLSEGQFQWLCRIIFFASPFSLWMIGSLLYVSLFRDRRIALTRDSLIIPRNTRMGLSCDELEIPFSEITCVDIVAGPGPAQLLSVRYSGGTVYAPCNMFLSRECFMEAVRAVRSAAGYGEDPADLGDPP